MKKTKKDKKTNIMKELKGCKGTLFVAIGQQIDAPSSALNNMGKSKKTSNENRIDTKTIKSPDGDRPYVSSPSYRRSYRDTLTREHGWKPSPVSTMMKKDKKQAVTKGDPLQYPDDDCFGGMCADKVDTGKKNKQGKVITEDVTVTRTSPMKCSPLIGFPIPVKTDYNVMTRGFEGAPIPFEQQFYSNIFKGIISIDITSVGRYTNIDTAGMKNLSEKLIAEYEEKAKKDGDDTYLLPPDEKERRIAKLIYALTNISGGAMQTGHLTDITPKIIMLVVMKGGNNIFMSVLPRKCENTENGCILVDEKALYQQLEDYSHTFSTPVYIGQLHGFGKDLSSFKPPEGVEVVITTPVKAITQFIEKCIDKGLFR